MWKRLFSIGVQGVLLAAFSAGCVSRDPEERLAKMGPVFGRSAVNFKVSSAGDGLDLDSAVDVARTIGRYRRLNYGEAETVRRLAQSKFDGFVLREIKNLQPAYEARKREVRAQSRKRVGSARKRIGDTAALRKEESEIRETEAKALEKIDGEIRSQALIAVRRRYGSQIAVPLKTRDNKPAVAIAKIRGGRVEAPDIAVELDRKPGSSVIEHEGKRATVIGDEARLEP